MVQCEEMFRSRKHCQNLRSHTHSEGFHEQLLGTSASNGDVMTLTNDSLDRLALHDAFCIFSLQQGDSP